jgi:hypothetical protein
VDGERGGTIAGPLIGARAHRLVVAPPASGLSAEPYPRGRRSAHDGIHGDGLHSGRPSESTDSTPSSGRFFFL